MLDLTKIDKSWTLFLDRDGVINEEKAQDYVYHYHEFIFYNGVPEAMKVFAETFGPIIITTNQRGVGKGLMTEHDLHEIHKNMVADITTAGGRIDSIYFASSVYDDDPLRKPQTGMALLAQTDFPQIDFSKSIMVGNNISDMEFGRNAGMHTVFLKTTSPDTQLPHATIDLAFESLADFAKALHNK
jgi:D-glycero-D-manno-heptose 1,7-bisphosphate phosphatase